MKKTYPLIVVTLLALSGCTQLSAEDRALIDQANAQSAAAENEARAACVAAEKAAADARAASERADRIFRQGQNK